jgi:hypothetical protein
VVGALYWARHVRVWVNRYRNGRPVLFDPQLFGARSDRRPQPSARQRQLYPYHHRFMFGTVASTLAATFGTKGPPISLSTAYASGATAIQLGVEAIRRGETDAPKTRNASQQERDYQRAP